MKAFPGRAALADLESKLKNNQKRTVKLKDLETRSNLMLQ
jgi:hypothetical protein